ncbi:hypothetical protein ACTFIU_009990 [Dictyostelium citrinum]
MKKLFILLSLFVLILKNDFVKSVTYLDMTPYEKHDCSGNEPAGIGYSLIVNECFAIDRQFFMVEFNHDHSNATVNQYHDNKCSKIVNETEKTFEINECYQAPNYVWNNGVQPNNFVKISISINPNYIPQYGFRQTTFPPGDINCQSNPWFYWYATNETKLHQDDDTVYFYCIDNQTYETFCDPDCESSYASLSCIQSYEGEDPFGHVEETC